MTSPNGEIPDGAYVGSAISDLNDWSEESAMSAMQGTMSPSFERQRDGVWQEGGLLGHIADFLFGSGAGMPAARLSDGMTALNGRLDLLDDVPGYAGAIMTQNHRFSSGSSFKTIPFNSKYGPEKNATLSGNRMYMTSGSWSAHFTISTSSGVGGIGHGLRARVRNATGAVVIERFFDWQNNGSTWDQHFAMPIVAPESGWSIELGYRHSGSWWTVLGGTEKTLIWVERKNLDTDNYQVIIPTDGADIT